MLLSAVRVHADVLDVHNSVFSLELGMEVLDSALIDDSLLAEEGKRRMGIYFDVLLDLFHDTFPTHFSIDQQSNSVFFLALPSVLFDHDGMNCGVCGVELKQVGKQLLLRGLIGSGVFIYLPHHGIELALLGYVLEDIENDEGGGDEELSWKINHTLYC